MIAPKLKQGQYSLIRAEKSTGILLNRAGTSYLKTGDVAFDVFDSMYSLEQYVLNLDERSLLEFLVYDTDGTFVKTMTF